MGVSPKLSFPFKIPFNEKKLRTQRFNLEDEKYIDTPDYDFMSRYRPNMTTADWYLSMIN